MYAKGSEAYGAHKVYDPLHAAVSMASPCWQHLAAQNVVIVGARFSLRTGSSDLSLQYNCSADHAYGGL